MFIKVFLRNSGPDSSTVGGESCWKEIPGFSENRSKIQGGKLGEKVCWLNKPYKCKNLPEFNL